MALILLLEGSQILALSLDITLKLRYLAETILWACEEPRPRPDHAIRILRTTIADMEIDYSRGAINEQIAITRILDDLPNHPLCPSYRTGQVPIIRDMLSDLVGNVTAALFSTMRIMPSNQTDPGHLSSDQLLQRYMALLEFVYVYYFAVASLTMFFFGGFVLLARRHTLHRCTSISTTTRLTLGVLLASLVSFSRYFPLVYSFMTSPAILYAFTLTLLLGELLSCIGMDQVRSLTGIRSTFSRSVLGLVPELQRADAGQRRTLMSFRPPSILCLSFLTNGLPLYCHIIIARAQKGTTRGGLRQSNHLSGLHRAMGLCGC